jgi:8-oxo-dGTP pyrophosphatase MutT (NUDIX family)
VNDVTLHRVDELSFALTHWDWPFARERRADMDAFWAKMSEANPKVWNGRVLLLKSFAVEGAACRGAFFETDFADFAAWNKWGFPPAAAWNGFAMGALRSDDGAFLLGVMGPQTLNAGRIYFPAGTPDRNDIGGDGVDLERSLMREVAEETGLAPGDYRPEKHWTVVVEGARVACIRVLDVPLPADALRARILSTLARETEPELTDIVIVRGVGDLRPQMSSLVVEFLQSRWA